VKSSISTTKRWRTAVGAAAVLLLGGAMAGCSVGSGAPDGWVYMNAHGIALAYPKGWNQLPAAGLPSNVLGGAVLKKQGQAVGEVEVLTGVKQQRPEGVKVKTSAAFKLGGYPATQLSYVYAPDPLGPKMRVMDVTARNAHGTPVLVRITGNATDVSQDTMARIADSIQIGTIGKGYVLKS
jgi:hypothetical protein